MSEAKYARINYAMTKSQGLTYPAPHGRTLVCCYTCRTICSIRLASELEWFCDEPHRTVSMPSRNHISRTRVLACRAPRILSRHRIACVFITISSVAMKRRDAYIRLRFEKSNLIYCHGSPWDTKVVILVIPDCAHRVGTKNTSEKCLHISLDKFLASYPPFDFMQSSQLTSSFLCYACTYLFFSHQLHNG